MDERYKFASAWNGGSQFIEGETYVLVSALSAVESQRDKLAGELRSIAEYDCVNSHTNKCDGCASCDAREVLTSGEYLRSTPPKEGQHG